MDDESYYSFTSIYQKVDKNSNKNLQEEYIISQDRNFDLLTKYIFIPESENFQIELKIDINIEYGYFEKLFNKSEKLKLFLDSIHNLIERYNLKINNKIKITESSLKGIYEIKSENCKMILLKKILNQVQNDKAFHVILCILNIRVNNQFFLDSFNLHYPMAIG